MQSSISPTKKTLLDVNDYITSVEKVYLPRLKNSDELGKKISNALDEQFIINAPFKISNELNKNIIINASLFNKITYDPYGIEKLVELNEYTKQNIVYIKENLEVILAVMPALEKQIRHIQDNEFLSALNMLFLAKILEAIEKNLSNTISNVHNLTFETNNAFDATKAHLDRLEHGVDYLSDKIEDLGNDYVNSLVQTQNTLSDLDKRIKLMENTNDCNNRLLEFERIFNNAHGGKDNYVSTASKVEILINEAGRSC